MVLIHQSHRLQFCQCIIGYNFANVSVGLLLSHHGYGGTISVMHPLIFVNFANLVGSVVYQVADVPFTHLTSLVQTVEALLKDIFHSPWKFCDSEMSRLESTILAMSIEERHVCIRTLSFAFEVERVAGSEEAALS